MLPSLQYESWSFLSTYKLKSKTKKKAGLFECMSLGTKTLSFNELNVDYLNTILFCVLTH